MAGLSDFIFGKGALNKAAGGASIPMTPPAQPANINIAKAAEDIAKQKKQVPAPKPIPAQSPGKIK